MHILFEEESAATVDELIAQQDESEGWYCIPSAIGDVVRVLRDEIRQHVVDTAAARRMEHRLLLLESLAAAEGRGRAFWSGSIEP
jgi:hypothetical protein